MTKAKDPKPPRPRRTGPAAKTNPTTGGFQISGELWEVLEPLIPQRVNTHRFGGGRPWVPGRTCANGIFYVLRTGCQWKVLDATGICSGSTARLRFQEWVAAGVTEAAGVPVGLAVDGANRHDMKLVRVTVDSMAVDRPAPSPEHPQGLCLDKGYDFAEARLGGIRLHRPHTQSGRGGSGHQGGGRFQSQALGGGRHAQLAEPFPAHPGTLGQVPGELHRLSSFRLCPHHPPRRRVIRIGS